MLNKEVFECIGSFLLALIPAGIITLGIYLEILSIKTIIPMWLLTLVVFCVFGVVYINLHHKYFQNPTTQV